MTPLTTPRLLAATCLALAAGIAQAAEIDAKAMLQLADQSGCLACHAIDKRKVGPSYAEIAARYRAQPGALRMLQDAILYGHSGSWGVIPMPAYGGAQQVLTEPQALDLARWVLSLAPAGAEPAASTPSGGSPRPATGAK